jgi:hypothetical protein
VLLPLTCVGCVATEAGTETGTDEGALAEESCAMAQLLQDKCQSCHGETPTAGAPMSLVSWDDLMAPAPSDASSRVYEVVHQRVNAATGFMPPTGHLDETELAVVDDWMRQGADDCGFGAKADPETNAEDGGAPAVEPETCFELRAHGAQASDDETPFMVAPRQFYQDFFFTTPYDRKVTALTFTPLIDNAQVIHHWLLYAKGASNEADGSYAEGSGSHTGDDELVIGWAPGGAATRLPPGVGLQLPEPGKVFQLEVHYFNSLGEPVEDRSGVRVCVTSEPLENIASATTLGAELLLIPAGSTRTFTGTCTPGFDGGNATTDIHVLFSSPHMHKTGTHMKTVIHRVDGSEEILIDKPFVFTEQAAYPTPTLIHPGDTLTTECTFVNQGSSFVTYGPNTDQEMCYNFIYAYPANLLANPGGSLVGSANTCLR